MRINRLAHIGAKYRLYLYGGLPEEQDAEYARDVNGARRQAPPVHNDLKSVSIFAC